MPKQIVRDVFGELIETGKATAGAGKKAVSDVAGQTVKTLTGQAGTTKKSGDGLSGLDWLERGAKGLKSSSGPMKQKVKSEDEVQKEQIERLNQMDKKQSTAAYKQIQDSIRMIQQQKASALRKYETGKAEFDEERVKDPESFFDKVKKKQEEIKKKLPWASRQSQGTGEIGRGASG